VLNLGSYHTAWQWLHKLRRAKVCPGRDRLSEKSLRNGDVALKEKLWLVIGRSEDVDSDKDNINTIVAGLFMSF
jgi:hypothetical protein